MPIVGYYYIGILLFRAVAKTSVSPKGIFSSMESLKPILDMHHIKGSPQNYKPQLRCSLMGFRGFLMTDGPSSGLYHP